MKLHGAKLIIGLAVFAMAMLDVPAFAKGRVTEEKVITEPTEFNGMMIAAGTIRIFKDNGDLAFGTLANKQYLFGVEFAAGTKVTVPDYPLSMNHHDLIVEPGGTILAAGMQLGEWMEFAENQETGTVTVMTNLIAPAHVVGIDIAKQFYFRYQCDYTNCNQVQRLTDFTLVNDTMINGIPAPAGTRVENTWITGFYLSKDIEVQGFPIMAADGNSRALYINQFGRVIQFNAARTFTYKGIEIPAGYFVRLDNDGNPKVIGNQTFP